MDEVGRIVGFYSDASNLVPMDSNQVRDVFVRDAVSGVTERVSVSSTGEQANGPSHWGAGAVGVSSDGSVIAFYSEATNLVAGDTNRQTDVFVRLRNLGITQRVSLASDGRQGNGMSSLPAISGDGRLIVFQSEASNLVPGDTNNVSDIFVHDRISGITVRACDVQPNRGSSNPTISRDGTVVAFMSGASNLVSGDTNGWIDVFVCELGTGRIERVSLSSSGEQGNGDSILPALSADGRFVGFKSIATNLVAGDLNNLVDVFVHDRQTGITERVSVGHDGSNANDFSFPPSLSNDGRFVTFGSAATNLIANDNNKVADVFIRDRQIGVTVVASVNDRGELANGGTPDVPPAMSGDGRRVAFASFATNLVPEDRNPIGDIYLAQNPFFGPNSCPDGTCPGGSVCVRGFCVSPTPTRTVTRTPTATRTGTPTPTPTPTPTFRVCVDDSDCKPGEHCRGGTCKKKRECDDNDPAIDRLMCFDREACIGGLCECGGDCNLDGFVFGNEVTNAVYVLGGLLPLDQCAAADINGDGDVMGNEITQAVLNLGRGCVQEGQPLLFSRDRGGLVTLTIEADATVAGSVNVTVSASGGGGEIATVQMDLLFDPSVLSMGNPGEACTLHPRLQSTHTLLATLPTSPSAPPGMARLRLFAGDLSDPIAMFPDGPVVSCRFGVHADAPTATLLGADRLNVGDNRADTFGTQAVGGGISLLIPTPGPSEGTANSCGGDCDGDGEVFGNEITTVVQMMAGHLPVSECPAGDSDGDGEATVTDVTRAVINLGRGCPR
jgi:Tol biopolymer transport system component